MVRLKQVKGTMGMRDATTGAIWHSCYQTTKIVLCSPQQDQKHTYSLSHQDKFVLGLLGTRGNHAGYMIELSVI